MDRRTAPLRMAVLAGLAALASMPAAAQDFAIVARRVIYPGETIDAAALAEVKVRQKNALGASIAVAFEQLDGKVARRTLLPGRLIPVSAVREPYAVEAGSPVTVTYVEGAMRITTTAVPLQPGAVGDMIKVRNPDGGAVFSGIVLADGTIRVGSL